MVPRVVAEDILDPEPVAQEHLLDFLAADSREELDLGAVVAVTLHYLG